MRRALALSLVLASTLASHLAHASDVQACLAASEKGQRSRSAGKLREARDQFLVCGGEGCPAIVRRDCTQWQGEVMATLPSVVFGAKDTEGRDLFDVTVSMDGEILVKKLDGKAVSVDPGPHTFEFQSAGAPPIVERALVKEGEKARVITVAFGGGRAAVKPDRESGNSSDDGHTIFPWLVVGAGAATLVVGAVIYATAPALPPGCNEATQTCVKQPTESDAAFRARQEEAGESDAQPTRGLVVGGVGLGVAVIGLAWHFLEPSGRERTTGLRVSPWAAPGSSGVTLGAKF